MTKLKIGDAPLRNEDQRFLTGQGCYVDDLSMANMAHAVILRAHHAHAEIVKLDTERATTSPGVIAILTGQDLASAGVGPMDPIEKTNIYSGTAFNFPIQYPLAKDLVRYVGEPIALIIAETQNQALDAMTLIDVDYAERPAITSIAAAIATEDAENICLEWRVGDKDGTEAAFKNAAHVTKLDLHNHRIATNSMEPRGGVGIFDEESGRYTLHISAQSLHVTRDRIADALGVEANQVRLVAPDVGGGFGVKNFLYPEMILLCWAARIAGRPVKWIATRSEGFISDHQARDNDARAELALDADGNFTALRVWSRGNLGAYLTGSMARIYTEQFVKLPGGPYQIPFVDVDVGAVYTNTVPTGVTRGPGFAEFANIMERLIDCAARETGRDSVTLRQKNLVPLDAMPHTNAVGAVIDSGHFPQNLKAAMHRATDGIEDRKRAAKARGRLLGLGIGYHIKATFGLPEENVELQFEDNGTLTFTTGTQAIGQGHETSFPQIISDLLGIDARLVNYRAGDTDLIAMGGGHGSSRATFMAGTATFFAVETIKEKGRPIAARMLEAAETDIDFADGAFVITGTDRRVDLFEVAAKAKAEGMPLDTYHRFVRENHTFPNGCHIAEVEIDPETGATSVQRYTACDDYGTVINPMIVEGQLHGAIAQGIGQAMGEHVRFEQETGQLLSGTFMDYCMPRADDLPSFDVSLDGTTCTTNPLGVKGAGEAGAIAGYPAVANAILDAVRPHGITILDGPATPETIWRLLNPQ